MTLSNLDLSPISLTQPTTHNINHSPTIWGLAPDSTPGGISFPSKLTPNQIHDIIKIGKSFNVQTSKTGALGIGQENLEIRSSQNSWITPCDLSRWLYEYITDMIQEVNSVHYGFDLAHIEVLQFTRYCDDVQGRYNKHIDCFEYAHNSCSHRKLSFSIQLSEPDSYEGGHLLLFDGRQQLDEMEPAPRDLGMISFFPSYTLHEVTPITKGIRYSLVGWVNGPKFR
jgi:PKHD-type hydroxylase